MSMSENHEGGSYGDYKNVVEYHRNYRQQNPEKYLRYRIVSAIRLLESNGYKVSKEEGK